MNRARSRRRRDRDWSTLSGDDLMECRIRDLGLTIEGSMLAGRVEDLYRQLDARGIAFHPPCYLGDEWASPDGVPAIAIPFYLAHPRLRELERSMMFEVEGEEVEQCMRILRHEAGHAIDHAFELNAMSEWREQFGTSDQEYRDVYRVRPTSRKYVRNLRHWYAQMHPDEDFAETFAVWLDPGVDWKTEYAGWEAISKLTFVDDLMQRVVAGQAPRVKPRAKEYVCVARRMRSRLKTFYDRRVRMCARLAPDFTDRDLRRIFSGTNAGAPPKAGAFLRRRHVELARSVSRWGGELTCTVRMLLERMEKRCDALGLRLGRTERETLVETSSFLMTLIVNDRYARLNKESS